MNFEDKTHLASLKDKDTRGDKVSDINVLKLENSDEHLKVEWKNGALLEEKSDNCHDIEHIIDEYHFLFAPINKDRENIALFNSSNNSCMFDTLLKIESEVEPNCYSTREWGCRNWRGEIS